MTHRRQWRDSHAHWRVIIVSSVAADSQATLTRQWRRPTISGGIMDLQTPVRARPLHHVVSVRHGEALVLLDAALGRYYSLNVLAAEIWSLLCDGLTTADLHAQLLTEYAVSSDRLSEVLADFLGKLQSNRLVSCE
jgi:hypothetical protein